MNPQKKREPGFAGLSRGKAARRRADRERQTAARRAVKICRICGCTSRQSIFVEPDLCIRCNG